MTAKAWVKTDEYEGECRRAPNGLQRLLWTIMVSACGVVFIGYSGWMIHLSNQLNVLQSMSLTREGHLSTLITQMGEIGARIERNETRMIRLEDKMDRLLERRPSR